MAVEDFLAENLKTGVRQFPIDDYGKLRLIHFEIIPGVAGDAGSTAQLCKLPHGRIRLIPNLSRFWHDAFGSSRVLDIGHAAYTKEGGVDEVADPDAFVVDNDVASAGTAKVLGTARKFDMFSRKGIVVTATIAGGTWPSGCKLNGYLAVVTE